MYRSALVLAVVLPLLTAHADDRPADPASSWKEADSRDGRWNESDVGPFLASVLPVPGGPIAKGLSIRVGAKRQASVGYDTATMDLRAAWTGGLLTFDPARYGIVRSPKPAGPIDWSMAGGQWSGGEVHYRGLYQHGERVVLSYQVADRPVLESPGAFGESPTIVRTFDVAPGGTPVTLTIRHPKEEGRAVRAAADAKLIDIAETTTTVRIPASKSVTHFSVLIGPNVGLTDHVIEALAINPTRLAKPGGPLWTPLLETTGTRGEGDGPYVVDTITVPFDNPWKSLLFLAGLDFLSDGTAVVSAMHGDVWLVKGIDDNLAKVTWKRFATGLHQPLGLKVIDDEIFVLGRDQITRLHDRNDDGEADWYECFNNDGATSKGGHDFAACLEADPAGNLYYIRAHEGVCRVSADGSTHESLAKGFRNPIGLGVSPTGMVTAAPQEGTWTPKSAIFEVKPGGWYGFGGPRVTESRPLGYDPPICWMPRLSDNSSGGQCWPTDKRFGPLAGRMLHLSYGQCAALLVMHEHVDGVPQGATLRLPMFFESGVMTGRTNPKDGQLYVAGLRGWQTAAARDGCLQRVRYTGKPGCWPVEWHVKRTGIEVAFSAPLDEATAADPQNWAVEQWNYRYSKEYGSKDYLVSEPRKTGREEIFLEDVTLSADGRRVFLAFEDDVVPVMQMGVTYNVKTAAGAVLKDTLYGTVNSVPK